MVLAETPQNRNKLNKRPRHVPEIPDAAEIRRYVELISQTKHVFDLDGNRYCADMIAGDEIHLAPIPSGQNKVDSKARTTKMLKLDPKDMIGNYFPCDESGNLMSDSESQGPTTGEFVRVIKPLTPEQIKAGEDAARAKKEETRESKRQRVLMQDKPRDKRWGDVQAEGSLAGQTAEPESEPATQRQRSRRTVRVNMEKAHTGGFVDGKLVTPPDTKEEEAKPATKKPATPQERLPSPKELLGETPGYDGFGKRMRRSRRRGNSGRAEQEIISKRRRPTRREAHGE